MENSTKLVIGAGIIALLVWYSKKGKVTETPTEEPSGGGGGGGGGIGGGGSLPSALIVTTNPTTSTTTTTTTPSKLLGKPVVVDFAKPNLTMVNGGGLVNTTTNPTPLIKQPTLPAVQVNTTAIKPTMINSGGFSAVSNSPYTSTYTTVICNNGKKYNVSDADIKAAGGVTKWCTKNGHSVATNVVTNPVPFDGKITRPLSKVDFF